MKPCIRNVLLGVVFGIAFEHILSIIFSIVMEFGYYTCLAPLREPLGGEVNVIVFQTAVCAVVGAVIGLIVARRRNKR